MKEIESTLPPPTPSSGILANVPIEFLHGIQRREEYQTSKIKRIKNGINTEGLSFYYNHPISLGFLPENEGGILFIFDGHHRAREAGNQGIHAIPAWIFPTWALAQTASELNSKFKEVSLFELQISKWVTEVIQDFSFAYNQSNKPYLLPKDFGDIRSFSEFKAIVQGENQYNIFTNNQLIAQ